MSLPTLTATPLSTALTRRLYQARVHASYVYHPAETLFAAMHPWSWQDVALERDDWRLLADPDGTSNDWPRLPELGETDESKWVRLLDIPLFGDTAMADDGGVRVWCSWQRTVRDAELPLPVNFGHPADWMTVATRTGHVPTRQERVVVDREADDGIHFSLQPMPVGKDESLRPGVVRFDCGWTPPS